LPDLITFVFPSALDNPFFGTNVYVALQDGKSLFTTIRELVENSLDAAEGIRVLPKISIELMEYDESQFHQQVGYAGVQQRNVSLYRKEYVDETAGNEAADDKGGDGGTKEKGKAKGKSRLFYSVVVRDNGCGMRHDDVPNMLGRVLSGTKYGVQQTRGKFGLGAKMALLWSKMSTGQPIRVRTSRGASEKVTVCVLDLNEKSNEPIIRAHEKEENVEGWRGTEISLFIAGNFGSHRSYILKYLSSMAVITPYADFTFAFTPAPEIGRTKPFTIHYSPRSDLIPPLPAEVKHHPASVDQMIVDSLKEACDARTSLKSFLTKSFQCITSSYAYSICEELKLDPTVPIEALTREDVAHMTGLFHKLDVKAPDGGALSPIGEYNLRLGVEKEISPLLLSTAASGIHAVEGHAFMVEAAVCLGSNESGMQPGIHVYRFANRIPLLFEPGADVVTKVCSEDIPWSSYKINRKTDRIGVFVSTVSTRIPFKGAGKEYVGADCVPIRGAIKSCIQNCCSQLRVKLRKREAEKRQKDKKKLLLKYIPDVARALTIVAEDIAGNEALQERYAQQSKQGWHAGLAPNEQALLQALHRHVDEVYEEDLLAVEEGTALSGKRKKIPIFLPNRASGTEMQLLLSNSDVFCSLLQGALNENLAGK
jgi:DNA topoisomerase VI subunit B